MGGQLLMIKLTSAQLSFAAVGTWLSLAKALASILHVGAARSHRANPIMSIRVEKLYATPVLLSGIGSLILLKKWLLLKSTSVSLYAPYNVYLKTPLDV